MANHLTPTELAREAGLERREVISKCMELGVPILDRKSTRLNSSHANISYAVFCLIKNLVYPGALVAASNFSDPCLIYLPFRLTPLTLAPCSPTTAYPSYLLIHVAAALPADRLSVF